MEGKHISQSQLQGAASSKRALLMEARSRKALETLEDGDWGLRLLDPTSQYWQRKGHSK